MYIPAYIVTGRMPRSGKLPVLNLLTGQKSDFSPRRGDSLHRFTSNLAGPPGMRVRLVVQNFTSIATGGGNTGRLPWPISKIVRGFYAPNYPTWVFQIWRDLLHRLLSYCWETARRSIRPIFSVHSVGKTTCVGSKNERQLFWWARGALSPCKVWWRSHYARRL